MVEVDVSWAQKNEGYIYGDGAASLAKRIAEAAAGKASAKEQAAAVFEVAKAVAAEWGFKPEIEVFMAEPGDRRNPSAGAYYRVCWESGPYQWAIVASEALCQVGVFAEPYYSFDLCFYPSEDR